MTVDRARRADDAILMKLHGVDDRDRADELRGALVCVQRESFPPLDEGEFYVCDVEGARVSMRRGEPRALGTVRELRNYPSVDVLVVVGERRREGLGGPARRGVRRAGRRGAAARSSLKTLDGLERG